MSELLHPSQISASESLAVLHLFGAFGPNARSTAGNQTTNHSVPPSLPDLLPSHFQGFTVRFQSLRGRKKDHQRNTFPKKEGQNGKNGKKSGCFDVGWLKTKRHLWPDFLSAQCMFYPKNQLVSCATIYRQPGWDIWFHPAANAWKCAASQSVQCCLSSHLSHAKRKGWYWVHPKHLVMDTTTPCASSCLSIQLGAMPWQWQDPGSQESGFTMFHLQVLLITITVSPLNKN